MRAGPQYHLSDSAAGGTDSQTSDGPANTSSFRAVGVRGRTGRSRNVHGSTHAT